MVTVKVVDTVPGGVTDAGEKLHKAPVGKPEQSNRTGDPNPPTGVIETVVVALFPAVAEIDDEEDATEKS